MSPDPVPAQHRDTDTVDTEPPSDTSSKGFFKAPAALVAALILVVRDLCPGWKWWPKTATILKLLGAGKSQTYAYVETVRKHLPGMVGRPGRPRSPVSNNGAALESVLKAVNAYLRAHPGAVCENGSRSLYSDDWRRFVVGLLDAGQPGHGMSLADLAEATGVPLGTLKTWYRPGSEAPPVPTSQSPEPTPPSSAPPTAPSDVSGVAEPVPPAAAPPGAATASVPSVVDGIRDSHQRLILTAWPTWTGSFKGFCHTLRTEHRLPYGDTFIGSFLEAVGGRHRTRRRPTEAPWSSGTYRTFYPGAHWVGDGHEARVLWPEQGFVFNIEGIQDPAADAIMGFAVTDTEDEEAVRVAYEESLKTSMGQPPEALTLDNKPSNHSPATQAATAGTVLLRSTPGRGQAKAPIEGLWGLFQQEMGPLVVEGDTDREKARSVLRLVFEAWARGRNGKPRKKLKGKTPAEAYMQARPTPEEVERARAWIAEQKRRQDKFQETREARQDPVRLQMLRKGLSDLSIPDPDGHLAVALACYSTDAIVRGLATLKAKQDCGSIPFDIDDLGRYLGGIIRNLHARLEADNVSQELFERRLRLGDVTLAPLQRAVEDLHGLAPAERAKACVDRALDAKWEVDVRFWTQAAAEALTAVPAADQRALYDTLSRRISASFRTDRDRRIDIIDRLAMAATASIAASIRAASGDKTLHRVAPVLVPAAMSTSCPTVTGPVSVAPSGLGALASSVLPHHVVAGAASPTPEGSANSRCDTRHGSTILPEARVLQDQGALHPSRYAVHPAGRAP